MRTCQDVNCTTHRSSATTLHPTSPARLLFMGFNGTVLEMLFHCSSLAKTYYPKWHYSVGTVLENDAKNSNGNCISQYDKYIINFLLIKYLVKVQTSFLLNMGMCD